MKSRKSMLSVERTMGSFTEPYCWWKDGYGKYPDLQGFIHVRCLFGISEPSTVWLLKRRQEQTYGGTLKTPKITKRFFKKPNRQERHKKAGWNKKIQCKNFPINKWSWKSWWPPRHGGQIISQRRVTWDLELRMNSLCRTGKRLKSSRTSRMRKRIWTPQELWGRHPMNLQGINWDVCMFTYIKWL